MHSQYVEIRDGGYFIANSRVSLDSIVYAYLRGESPDGIAESFPLLTRDQIAGALAFYSSDRENVDRYLAQGRADFEILRLEGRLSHPALHAKLAEAKARSHTPTGA